MCIATRLLLPNVLTALALRSSARKCKYSVQRGLILAAFEAVFDPLRINSGRGCERALWLPTLQSQTVRSLPS